MSVVEIPAFADPFVGEDLKLWTAYRELQNNGNTQVPCCRRGLVLFGFCSNPLNVVVGN